MQTLDAVKSVQVEMPGKESEKVFMTFNKFTKAGKNAWFFYDKEQNVVTMKIQDGCLHLSLKLAKDYAF